MQHYIIRRVLLNIPVLLVVSFFAFLIIRLAPGDIIALKMQAAAYTEAEAQQIREELGLDRPLLEQYVRWLTRIILKADFGVSFWTKTPIRDNLAAALPVTIQLAAMAMAIGVLIAIPTGIIAAMKQDQPLDYGLRFFAMAFQAVPNFWLATLFLLYASLWFGWSPPLEYKRPWEDLSANLQKMIPASVLLGIALSATTARLVRSQMLEVLRQDYIRTARAKGLAERPIMLRHALKNAMIPIITLIGGQLGVLLGGAVIFEFVLGMPGLGGLTVDSIRQRDYPQLQANTLVFATMLVFVNLIVDLSYAWFDPRIRYK